ncbi:hypothetical protein [uncultured Muribaculum sp.]|nr:hypothetical protein [uncultured Muribaculum sp.]
MSRKDPETCQTCIFYQPDGDTRPYIKNCAEEVHQALTEKV